MSRSLYTKPTGGVAVGKPSAAAPSPSAATQSKMDPRRPTALPANLNSSLPAQKKPLAPSALSATTGSVRKDDQLSTVRVTPPQARIAFIETQDAHKELIKCTESAPRPQLTTAPQHNTTQKLSPSTSVTDKKKEWIPQVAPFPEVLSPSVLAVLSGRQLEKPFTTESYKEYPSRGVYSCIRCRVPLMAATAKIPGEIGYSAFQSFRVESCNVAVHMFEERSELHVLCKGCNGFVGVLTQDIPTAAQALSTSGEMIKVNSCCLHFQDVPANDIKGIFDNYFVSKQRGGKRVSPAPDSDDDDPDADHDLLQDADFDDLDVIGTFNGATRAVERRKAQFAAWARTGSAGGGRTVVTDKPPQATQISMTGRVGASVSTAQRHGLAEEAINHHSDASDDSEDTSETSDDDECDGDES